MALKATGTALALAGLVTVPVLFAAGAEREDYSAWAQGIAAAALLALSLGLFATGPKRLTAKTGFSHSLGDGTERSFVKGEHVPESLAAAVKAAHRDDVDEQRGRYFRALYVGDDGRWSTSKLQPLLWTYALVFGLLSLVVAKWLGTPEGFDRQLNDLGLQEEYLLLLGGPFAAAIAAKLITSGKAENGEVQKTDATGAPSPAEGLGQVISDDAGNTDLVDFQYFLFNLLALAFFFGTFCFALQDGLPELPDILVGLTSASALAYVGKKAVERQKPQLTSISPTKGSPGQSVDVWGRNLVVEAPTSRPRPTGDRES